MNREFGFERQKQATSPHCINVWPRQARRRFSLGSRPGLKRFYPQSTNDLAVNMMVATDLNEATLLRYIDDDFEGYSYEQRWVSGVAGLTVPTLDFLNHQYYADYHATAKYGFMLTALSQDLAEPLYVHLKTVPYNNENAATYRVYFVQDDATPDPAVTGIEVVLTLSKNGSNDRLSWTINCLTAGAHEAGSPFTGTFDATLVDSRWLRVMYDVNGGTNTVSIYLDNSFVVSQTVTEPASGTNSRVGWSMRATSSGGRAIVDRVRVNWSDDVTRVTNVARLVCGGGGKIYHEAYGGDLSEVDAAYSLLQNEPVMAATRLTKAYIADWGDILYEDTNATVGSTGVGPPDQWQFESTPAVNLATLGVTVTNFVVEIVSYGGVVGTANTDVPPGSYSIDSLQSTGVGTNNTVRIVRFTTNLPSVGCTAHIRIRRGPKIYNASTGAMSQLEIGRLIQTEVTTYGFVPVGCHLACEYRDRLILADDNQYYGSQIGDFGVWAYAIDPDDPRSAWSGTLADAGSLGRRPTALIPFSDDYLLIAAADMIMRMTGDIAYGGRIEIAAREVGVIGPRAWVITPENVLYFLGRSGLYRMMPGGGNSPESVSKDVLPDELQNLNEHHTVVSLTYDPRDEAIDILIGGKREHQRRDSWRLDLRTGSLWPWRLPDGIEPTVAITTVRGYFYGQVQPLVGSRDGRIRFFDREAVLDDGGTAIDSILTLGPIRGGPHATAVHAIEANMSRDSRPTYVTVETGATPEDAVARAVVGTSYDFRHTLAAGRNRGIYARGVGGAACVSLRSLSGGMWRVEELAADVLPIERVL